MYCSWLSVAQPIWQLRLRSVLWSGFYLKVHDELTLSQALTTCADLIRGNAKLQEGFAQLQVIPVTHVQEATTDGKPQTNGVIKVHVIDGLLDLVLTISSIQAFDTRLAACECIKAYFYQHGPIRLHFLRRAIEGHVSGADETANVLSTLLNTHDTNRSKDPYRSWLASILLLHLIQDDSEAKALAMSVSEGDSSTGEEVVTCIQGLTGSLITGLQRSEDDRVSVGYLMLLCTWLYEDPDAVNDFLGEGSSVQSLVQAVLQGSGDAVVIQGLCAVLLGIVYEFSTKDSPIPRATLHQILSTRLGREHYVDKITKLREHPLLRDFEVLHQGLEPGQAGRLPNVFFDKSFVDFLKDNFSRLIRSIDRDPGMEIPVVANGIQKGISRELVDSLRTQLSDKTQALQKVEDDVLSLERRLGQEQADHRRTKETGIVELNRIKSVNEGLQKHHEDEARRFEGNHQAAVRSLETAQASTLEGLQRQLRQQGQVAEDQATRIRERNEAELKDLKTTISDLESRLEKAQKEHLQDLQTANDEYTSKSSMLEARAKRAEEKEAEAEDRAKRLAETVKEVEATMVEMKRSLGEKEDARSTAQAELEDLLIVLGDLEEKRMTDKVGLTCASMMLTIANLLLEAT